MNDILKKLIAFKGDLERKIRAIDDAIDVITEAMGEVGVELARLEPIVKNGEVIPRANGWEILNRGATHAIRRIFHDGERHSSRTLHLALKERINRNGMKFRLERKTVAGLICMLFNNGELDRWRTKCKITGRKIYKYKKTDSMKVA